MLVVSMTGFCLLAGLAHSSTEASFCMHEVKLNLLCCKNKRL